MSTRDELATAVMKREGKVCPVCGEDICWFRDSEIFTEGFDAAMASREVLELEDLVKDAHEYMHGRIFQAGSPWLSWLLRAKSLIDSSERAREASK